MSDSERYPMSIAVGVENLGSTTRTDAYLVSTKKFEGGFIGHFGFKATFTEVLNATAMFGLEYVIDEKFSFLGDLTGENQEYLLNLGMRFYLDPDVVFRGSILDVTRVRSDETVMVLGFSIEKFI